MGGVRNKMLRYGASPAGLPVGRHLQSLLQSLQKTLHFSLAAEIVICKVKVIIHFAAICTNPLYLEPICFQTAHSPITALIWWKSWLIGYQKSIICHMYRVRIL